MRRSHLKSDTTQNASDIAAQIKARVGSLGGGSTAELRSLRREFSKRLTKAPAAFVIELAFQLLDLRQMRYRFIAYELVQHHRPASSCLNARTLEQLGCHLDHWAAVDTFASYLSGPAWRERQVSDKLIQRWARSRDRWWRRAALVSTVPLNNKARGGSGDTARTVRICEVLIADRDEMVVKAMSLALLELAKRDPQSVRDFLKANQSKLASRVIREVNNKLQTGLKNPRP